MTTETARIAEQLRRSMEGGAWHGPAVLELLDGVGAAPARSRPIAGAHGIWELVLHLGGAYRLVLRRLRGDGTPLSPEEDWPALPAETSDDAWHGAVRTLRELDADARRAVASFDTARLDQPLVVNAPYTAYVQFIGLTQHNLYHAGQIALLKRALASHDSPP